MPSRIIMALILGGIYNIKVIEGDVWSELMGYMMTSVIYNSLRWVWDLKLHLSLTFIHHRHVMVVLFYFHTANHSPCHIKAALFQRTLVWRDADSFRTAYGVWWTGWNKWILSNCHFSEILHILMVDWIQSLIETEIHIK